MRFNYSSGSIELWTDQLKLAGIGKISEKNANKIPDVSKNAKGLGLDGYRRITLNLMQNRRRLSIKLSLFFLSI